MSFEWANALLFRLTESTQPAASGRETAEWHPHGGQSEPGQQPNYDLMFDLAKRLNHDWRTIMLNVAANANAPVTAVIDTGNGGQPQDRTQLLLNRTTGAVLNTRTFADGSLGQRLRAFVRFGHTGEYGGWPGQAIAALASLGACVLVYTGLALSIRSLAANLKRGRVSFPLTKPDAEQSVA